MKNNWITVKTWLYQWVVIFDFHHALIEINAYYIVYMHKSTIQEFSSKFSSNKQTSFIKASNAMSLIISWISPSVKWLLLRSDYFSICLEICQSSWVSPRHSVIVQSNRIIRYSNMKTLLDKEKMWNWKRYSEICNSNYYHWLHQRHRDE